MLSDTCYTFFYITAIIVLIIIAIVNKWYVLDKRNLFRQKLFWISVLTPLLSFIYFGVFAWWGKEPVLSAHGYSRFYEISKFPLLLLASAVPLASIVNNIHRTIQTETQINAAEKKNAVDRYLAHEKNFIEKTKEIFAHKLQSARDADGNLKKFTGKPNVVLFTTDEIRISNPYLLYTKIYNKSTIETTSDFTANPDFLAQLKDYLNIINIGLSVQTPLEKDNSLSYMIRFNTLSYNTALLLDHICASSISRVYCLIKHDGYQLKTFTLEEQTFIEVLETCYILSRKLIRVIYNEDIPHYDNIYDYIYMNKLRFNIRIHADYLQAFSSQEWVDYVSETLTIVPNEVGDTLAAET
ncbi:hypothetical protein ACNJ6L_004325 [Escherichia coli]|uniref:hypothetical protein n=1 Tax=Escherichia coli TaxID=562 RepID=UPI000BE5F689|nr:hypothetical protein [Escherichia coli]EFD0582961.1 hypothetical protein [Escherichia coli]EIK8116277.1 hypothetical protein [Escherichia coli]ELX8240487.1 hypothetical protein [Escherichia coli]